MKQALALTVLCDSSSIGLSCSNAQPVRLVARELMRRLNGLSIRSQAPLCPTVGRSCMGHLRLSGLKTTLCLTKLWLEIIGKRFLRRQSEDEQRAKVSINLSCAFINSFPQERHDFVFDYYQPLPALDPTLWDSCGSSIASICDDKDRQTHDDRSRR